jgi:hypothetical protein
MAVDLGALVKGRLVYAVREPALDDIRFERILRGFADHYDITAHGQTGFSFERGEGYLKAGRFDAFALVDGGRVDRIREPRPESEGNVVVLAPRFGWLRYDLNVRTTLAILAMISFIGAAVGSFDHFAGWIGGFATSVAATVLVVQWSLRRKLRDWLARQSWN